MSSITVKCPHCAISVHTTEQFVQLGDAAFRGIGSRVGWQVLHANCPACNQKVIWLAALQLIQAAPAYRLGTELLRILIWPQSSERPLDAAVPSEIASDFSEASRVLPISPQASAALTRRCLQQVLRDYGNTTAKNLFDQISEVIKAGHLPSSLEDQLSAVRVIGNFAAHPLKSQSTGTILPVDPHEAEWNLDVLESVFDYYFVKPALALTRKEALNKKLSAAGKPLLP